MLKKIALCAMLVLILAPAAVMAAGQQGPAQGIGNEAGTCLNVQHQAATDTAAREKFQNGQGQGSERASQNGDALMLRNRSCDQDCDQDQAMVRNMTRDQIRLNSESGLASESKGTGSNGDTRMVQNRSCDQGCDQDQAMVRTMTRDQIRLNSEPGLASESKGTGSNGDALMLQNRSCDQDCDQDQAMVRNMTRDQIRLDSGSVQQQDGTAGSAQNRFGLESDNGQNIMTRFVAQLGAQFRYMGGILQTLGQ